MSCGWCRHAAFLVDLLSGGARTALVNRQYSSCHSRFLPTMVHEALQRGSQLPQHVAEALQCPATTGHDKERGGAEVAGGVLPQPLLLRPRRGKVMRATLWLAGAAALTLANTAFVAVSFLFGFVLSFCGLFVVFGFV